MIKFQEDSTEPSQKSLNKYTIYADGSCIQNPGQGAFAYVILQQDKIIKKKSKAYRHTTNNRMEILGVIEALKSLPPSKVEIFSDSQYLVNSVNKRWLTNWYAKDFQGIKNPDLWRTLHFLLKTHLTTFIWIKGHNGNTYNELCDKMAKNASKWPYKRLLEDTGY